MMASANGDLVHVEDTRHVVWVNAVHIKAHDAMMHVCIGVADDGNEAELAEFFHAIGHKSFLAGFDNIDAHRFDVGDGCSGGVDACCVLRARLEFLGDRRPGGVLLGHVVDHLAAGKEGRHSVEQFVFAP